LVIFVNSMKRMLIFSFLIFCLQVSQGQENTLITENRMWSYLQDNCAPGVTEYKSFYTRFRGDTLLNGNLYKKVQLAEDESADQWKYTDEFVREQENRVYYFNTLLEEESLIYDFNLEVAEEVTVWNPLKPDGLQLIVNKIDSVLIMDSYHKRMELIIDEFSSPEYWIEGIGSEYGLLNSGGGVFLGICGNYLLLCANIDGLQVYQNPNYQTCFYNLLGEEDDEPDKTEMNYNSLTKKLQVSVPGNSPVRLMVTNISGVVIHRSMLDSQKAEIDFSFFSSGLFVVTAISKKSSVSKKILVN